ncbi:MAG: hypothetical protein GX447_03515 [Elusimicrobia bacterium]|nr:hypothetical protein [Elusimicrobiota bacterium]
MEKQNFRKIFLAAVSCLILISANVKAQTDEEIEKALTASIDKSTRFTNDEKTVSQTYPEYFTINENSIKITLKEVKEDSEIYQPPLITVSSQPSKDLQTALVNIEKIINIASKIWDIIKDNAPVSNIDTKYAVALPQGITAPSQLSGWSRPKVYIYGFYAENLYGIKTVDVEYRVIFTYGASYNGKGKYLTGVSVVPTKVDVAWGYRFDMQSYVPDSTVVNVGTSQNPLAALQLKLTWNISTFLKDSKNTSVYYIQGDGYFSEIASPFKNAGSSSLNALLKSDPKSIF